MMPQWQKKFGLDSICPTGEGKVAVLNIEIHDERLVGGAELMARVGLWAAAINGIKSLSDFQGASFDKTEGALEWLHFDQIRGCKGPDQWGKVSGRQAAGLSWMKAPSAPFQALACSRWRRRTL
jgi:hypothetical protein